MNYFTITPEEVLAPYVRSYWVLESEQPYTHFAMADGSAEMVFHCHGIFDELHLQSGTREKTFACGVQGPTSIPRRFSIDQGFGMFGVYLYPHAIPALLSMPATELSNQFPDLVSALGPEGRCLEERMIWAGDHTERVAIISAFFKSRLAKNKYPHHPVQLAIDEILRSRGAISIEALSAKYCISTRQFERKFKEYAGFSPKLYSRISRFHHALSAYPNKNYNSLASIAYDCGYFDQSHFISDFKEFSGLSPRQYYSGRSGATAWIDG